MTADTPTGPLVERVARALAERDLTRFALEDGPKRNLADAADLLRRAGIGEPAGLVWKEYDGGDTYIDNDNDNAPAVCPECGGDGGFDAERPGQVAVKCRYCNGTGEVPSEPADTEDDLLRRAGDFLCAVIENCDVSDGVCCCGDEMARHSEPMSCGHTPTDHGSYQASRAVEGWKAALAAGRSCAVSAEAIRAEIAWHDAEQKRLNALAIENMDTCQDAYLCGRADEHGIAAARLTALLPPAQEERADG